MPFPFYFDNMPEYDYLYVVDDSSVRQDFKNEKLAYVSPPQYYTWTTKTRQDQAT